MAAYTQIYNNAFAYLLVNEGTKYTDLGADRGGPTRYGVTLATLQTWRIGQGKTMPTATDVANLAQDEAQAIYYALYWAKMGCVAIRDEDVATAVFDAAVLTGVGHSSKVVQLVLNQANGAGLAVDGQLGPKTMVALNSCGRRPFLAAFVAAQQDYFLDIVIKDPTQQAFHRTWRRRAADYLGLVP